MLPFTYMELFFAKLFGLYFIIVGVIVLVRRDTIMPVLRRMSQERAFLLILGVVEVAAGVGLVIAFPRVSLDVPGIISLVGYMMLVEGIMYLAAPTTFVRRLITKFNRPIWYVLGGLFSIGAGIYLAGNGFGYF